MSIGTFTDFIDLAGELVGGKVVSANDEFFAPKENLLKPEAPIFIADKYTEFGKWMDGWETRRRRVPGNDWCIVKLGMPGVVRGVNVDTSFFTGNFPESCSIEATGTTDISQPDKLMWREIVPKSPLRGGTSNLFTVNDTGRWTHLRLNIFPDGGVARLRVHGIVMPDADKLKKQGQTADLAAAENGAVVICCNDMFFGKKDNLILPGRARTMGEGWETRRRRGPGHDWIVVKLCGRGIIRKIEVDTRHFKGNFPDSCTIEACRADHGPLSESDIRDRSDISWIEILPRQKLKADTQHLFERELSAAAQGVFDYVRLNIFPDGGVSRLRVYGAWKA